jgi:hypothetical protein
MHYDMDIQKENHRILEAAQEEEAAAVSRQLHEEREAQV